MSDKETMREFKTVHLFCSVFAILCAFSAGNALAGPTSRVSTGPDAIAARERLSQSMQGANPACIAKATKLLNACNTQVDTTTTACDSEQDSGMNSAVSMASNVANLIGQSTSSSVVAACGQMGAISAGANAAITAYRFNCMNDVSSCNESCAEVQTFLKENNYCSNLTGSTIPDQAGGINERAKDYRKTCNSFNDKVAEAQNAMNNLAATTLNSTQCAALASGTSMADLCVTNPALIGCSSITNVDCSNPTMSTNRVCVCAANPLDPTCNNSQNASNPNPVSNGWIGGSTPTTNGDGLGLSGADLNGLAGIEHGTPGSGGGDSVDGKQGGGANIGGGGGGGGLAGDGGGRGGAGSEMPQVNAGFYGGGGSGSFGSSSRYGGGSGGGANGASAGNAGGPNLRQFLPGGKYDPKLRGLAGLSGPDGITGPHSNIWQKVQNRYQVMSPSLLP